MLYRQDESRDKIYAELVRSLFATVVPASIMSLAFMLVAALIYRRFEDSAVLVLGAAGTAASLTRIIVFLRYRAEAHRDGLIVTRAHIMERDFALSYLAFALCLGAFGAQIFLHASAAAHMLTICLLVGYCAGVAAGVGLRPAIAIPSMVLAIVPAIVVAALKPDEIYWATSGIASALLAGGSYSMIERHRTAQREIGKRITFASMARSDGLTDLPNRLALREWFQKHVVLGSSPSAVAVHYLDLDGFKPVNDKFGHPVGDALLRAVGQRLANNLRTGDIAARLGGDEFAIIQRGLDRPDEARLLVHRLCNAMKQPFRIGEHEICISACVGSVSVQDCTDDLEQLISWADEALYTAKRQGQGTTALHVVRALHQAA